MNLPPAGDTPWHTTLWLGPRQQTPFQQGETFTAGPSCYRRSSAHPEWPTWRWSKGHRLHDISSLCDVCDQIDITELAERGGPMCLNSSLSAVTLASRTCRFCALICQSAKGWAQSRDFDNAEGAMDTISSILLEWRAGELFIFIPYAIGLANFRPSIANGLVLGRFQIHHKEDKTSAPQTDVIDASNQATGPLQSTTLHRLTAELREFINSPCCEICTPQQTRANHARGLQTTPDTTPFLPDRVIEILDSSTADPVKLRLRTTQGMTRGQYITLSHRWGGETPLKTTKDTLNSRIKGFTLTDMPRTFQDAILVAIALEIKYVWIDSLCIVQDDQQEWLEQSVKMGSVYANSTYTVAAHSAKQCHEGFLWRCQVPSDLCISPQRGGPEFFVPIPELHDAHVRRLFFDGELSQRAWVLQELTLSPRILHFVENVLIWECEHRSPDFRGLVARTSQREWAMLYPNTPYLQVSLDTSATLFRKAGLDLGHHSAWRELVQQYSSCQMSRKSDKLVAVAGILDLLRSSISDPEERHYHCGVFQSDIDRSLMWYRKVRKGKRQLERAPSWSWASVDAKVHFDALEADDNLKCLLRVKSVQHQDYTVEPTTHEPPSCRLAINAPLIRATVFVQESSGYSLKPEDYRPPNTQDGQVWVVRIYDHDDGAPFGWYIEDMNELFATPPPRWPPFPRGDVASTIFFLAVWCREEDGKPIRAWGLMLSPVEEKAGVYRRVGLGFVRNVEALKDAFISPEDIILV